MELPDVPDQIFFALTTKIVKKLDINNDSKHIFEILDLQYNFFPIELAPVYYSEIL